MNLQAFGVILIISINSCAFHSEPKNNQEFYEVSHLSELSGVYKNRGGPSGYLSETIWPNIKVIADPQTRHEDIEFIEVTSIGNSLTVKAIKNGCAIYEQRYLLGRDFEI